MACGVCPVEGCGRLMRKTAGGCTCPLHPENGIFPEVGADTIPPKKDLIDRSTKGSPPFSKEELKRGYRRG